MDTATDRFHAHTGSTPKSIDAAWQHAKNLWSSDSGSETWTSLKNLVNAVPGWALAVVIVALFGAASNSLFAAIPLAAATFLFATYVTVKRAILSALGEHETQKRS